MIILIIILAYIVSIFLCRWIELRYVLWKYNITYKRHIYPLGWFFSIVYILFICIDYLKEVIDNKRKSNQTSKFIKWFFVSHMYKNKIDKKIDNELSNLF